MKILSTIASRASPKASRLLTILSDTMCSTTSRGLLAETAFRWALTDFAQAATGCISGFFLSENISKLIRLGCIWRDKAALLSVTRLRTSGLRNVR
jgi:hypothetical protein